MKFETLRYIYDLLKKNVDEKHDLLKKAGNMGDTGGFLKDSQRHEFMKKLYLADCEYRDALLAFNSFKDIVWVAQTERRKDD